MFKFFRKEEKKSNLALKVQNLGFKIGNKWIVKDISFKVKQGDIYGIIGLSGGGKTTLLKLLMNLISKSSGKIEFFGGKINKKYIGFCPQEDSFFQELSIKENIILFSSLRGIDYKQAIERGKKLMKKLHLEEDIDNLAKNLSGGQRKRLNIILSIIHNPKIVLLDEPFAGLDYYNRKLLWNFFLNLKKSGITTILTTHLINEAQEYCNRILIIDKGKKFASGSVSELKRKFKFYAYLKVKFQYLSNKKFREIEEYCKKNNIKIVEKFENEVSFSLQEEKDEQRIIDFLKKKELHFKVVEFREPTLNDLFMITIKERIK